MKKITLLAVAALMAGSAFAQTSVGIQRPLVPNGTSYDDFAYITTADFNKSVDGLTAAFFESEEIHSTIVANQEKENGYEKKSLYRQGASVGDVDYVWMLNCQDFDNSKKRHKTETLGSENWNFGFDLTVAEGKSFTVNAIVFDLLVEQNPSYRIRIMKGAEEIYNSNWVTKTGGYNNEQWGAGSYCYITTDDVSFLFEKMNGENHVNYQAIQYYPGFEDGVGTKTPLPANLTLAAGTYRIIADVDFNKDSSKGMSFDRFLLEGTLSAATAINSITTEKVVKNGVMYNIAGQRISTPVRGQIYIMNGKKYIAK